jgi:hypothetical protein
MKSLLGVKLSHTPVLAIITFIIIVVVQMVNKFLFLDKNKPNLAQSLREKYHKAGLGFLYPFFQAGSIDMYKEKVYNGKRIIGIILYYLYLLGGLMLTEAVFNRYTMLLLLLVGVGVEFVSPAMLHLTCSNATKGIVGEIFCCGESLTWYYLGVIASILLNYHFLSKKKISSFLFVLLFLIIGALVGAYNALYVYKEFDQLKVNWCYATTISIIPYLLGGAFTFGSLGLLLTKF